MPELEFHFGVAVGEPPTTTIVKFHMDKVGITKSMERKRRLSAGQMQYVDGQEFGEFLISKGSSAFCKGVFEVLVKFMPDLYLPINPELNSEALVAIKKAKNGKIEASEELLDFVDIGEYWEVRTGPVSLAEAV